MSGVNLRFVKAWRWVLLAILIFNLGAGVYNMVIGSVFAFIPFVMVAGLAATLVLNNKTIRLRTEQLRPRPDYSLIASMERPIWGQAFEHAGAPQIARMEREVWGETLEPFANCPKCGRGHMVEEVQWAGFTKCDHCGHTDPF